MLGTLAEGTGRHIAEANYDFSKCYEHVDHHKLASLAESVGYPKVLLRASINSYRWSRTLLFDQNMVGDGVWPTRGIGAGSVFATFEITIYTIGAIRVLASMSPFARISNPY